jgi:hypothetical protein
MKDASNPPSQRETSENKEGENLKTTTVFVILSGEYLYARRKGDHYVPVR